jgi:zinc transporter ZupT
MINLILQFVFVGLFCGGIIGAIIGEPFLMGSCFTCALGCMMLIMFREFEDDSQ